jgi:hypothetical protein
MITPDILAEREERRMPLVGGLIAESLHIGSVLEGVTLSVTRVSRADVGDVDAGQPRTWTFLDFQAADEDADLLASALEQSLERNGGWYCDYRSNSETFVVFADRTFRYARGDESGRASAADYARSVGVPEAQLDWPE